MMDITLEQFARATQAPMLRAQRWYAPITNAMPVFDIDTKWRVAMFLAQVAHESGRFQWTKELWGPTPAQVTYERDPAQPWGAKLQKGDRNFKAYGLGNSQVGDGKRYMGRGPIQNTGRGNYAAARDRLRRLFPGAPDFEADPVQLEDPAWGARAACEFWCRNGLNEIADTGNLMQATRKINGGATGYDDRLALFNGAKEVFGC